MVNLITHEMLVLRARRWLKSRNYPVVLTEYASWNFSEIPDAIGLNGKNSVVIECKASRSDFQGDKRKDHRSSKSAFGNYRYYLTPPNIVCPEDIPEGWGLLYVMDKKIVTAKKAQLHSDIEIKAKECILLYSLVRRVIGHGLMDKILESY